MRQRNQIELMKRALDVKFPANHFFQFRAIHELSDSESANWNNKSRAQNCDFIVQPGRTIVNFVGRRHPIRPARIFSGKASADRGEINCRSDGCFIHSAELFEPAEKRLASGVREWSLQNWFSRSRSLTDKHDVAKNRAAGNRRGLHPWTTPT